jgi:hypothetical protein
LALGFPTEEFATTGYNGFLEVYVMRNIAASLIVLVLSGCATAGKQPVPLYEVLKKGDRIMVAKPIKLEPTNRVIYFQAGNVHSWWGADAWRTLCRLRVGDGVRSEALEGSVFEVITVRRTSHQNETNAEVAGVGLSLRTISGASANYLSCECWKDLETSPVQSDIMLEDFEDSVNGYLKIVNGEIAPSTKEVEK